MGEKTLYIKNDKIYVVFKRKQPGLWEYWMGRFATRLDAAVAAISMNDHLTRTKQETYNFRVFKTWWGSNADFGDMKLYSPANSYGMHLLSEYAYSWQSGKKEIHETAFYAVDSQKKLIFNGVYSKDTIHKVHDWSNENQGGTRENVKAMTTKQILTLEPELIDYIIVPCVWELDNSLWTDPKSEFAFDECHERRRVLATLMLSQIS